MKRIVFSKKQLCVFSSLFIMTAPYAGTPVWTFDPLTPTSITVTKNGTEVVSYMVTNRASVLHILSMKPITGVEQITGATGLCNNPFVLPSQTSCTLSLRVNGSHARTENTNGPVVCEADGSLECYRPSIADVLRIQVTSGGPFTVGGVIAGLTSSVQLEDNGANLETFSSNGPFTFSMPLQDGLPYDVTVATQPANQTCTVSNGTGVIYNADITNVAVNCATTSFSVGGIISGLTGTVQLNDGTDSQSYTTNGSFTFSTTLANGTPYNVTVVTQPAGQTCSVSNGIGTINNANVTNVTVICAANAYTVGGTISGLSGTVVLLNNGGDGDTVSSPATTFTFSTPVAEGAPYNVTVGTQPAGQICMVTNGSGTMGGAPVTNVGVSCAANVTTLSASLSNLALLTSGNARTITITNTGSETATSLSIGYPTWPTGTTASSTCGSSLGAGDTCTITVTPGANATSDCDTFPGSAPTPGVITVSASNVSSPVSTGVEVLAYGCIYEEGYVYAIDDTTPTTSSVGGTTYSLADNKNQNQDWSMATDMSGTGAASLTDGASNTALIVSDTTYGPGSAAQVCSTYEIDSSGNTPCVGANTCYTNWYLPAICQMATDTEPTPSCTTATPSIATNLPGSITGSMNCSAAPTPTTCLTQNYWSSSEYSYNEAWLQLYYGGTGSDLFTMDTPSSVRCVREFS